jgi:hypothetical protein
MSLPVQVALVDESGLFDAGALAEVAGALNEQMVEFRRYWRATPPTTVVAHPQRPPHTWAIVLRRELDSPGALGYHTDDGLQPYSLVDADDGDVTQTISHELLEMSADPWGSRYHGARLPDQVADYFARFGLAHESSRVHYLVEVCDPPEATAYEVGGVSVSDFVTPLWYRTNPPEGALMSYQGACWGPRTVAPGGYVSFHVDEDWWQLFASSTGHLSASHLGRFDKGRWSTVREWSDVMARRARDESDDGVVPEPLD